VILDYELKEQLYRDLNSGLLVFQK